MAATESPAALLRRAADRLAELAESLPKNFAGRRAFVMEVQPFATGSMTDVALTLGPAAAPLAAWLRTTAEYYAHLNIGEVLSDDQAVAIARAVLGETEG